MAQWGTGKPRSKEVEVKNASLLSFWKEVKEKQRGGDIGWLG